MKNHDRCLDFIYIVDWSEAIEKQCNKESTFGLVFCCLKFSCFFSPFFFSPV